MFHPFRQLCPPCPPDTIHLSLQLSPQLSVEPGRFRTTGQAMETSEFCSQTRDHSPPPEEADVNSGPGELVPSGEAGVRRRGSVQAGGNVDAPQVPKLNIKKDDEFFHFVLLCFAIGSLLVCYHYYTDWFISLGVGLLTFASLETLGIYFGLVYRIHSVLHAFIPLFQKLRLMEVTEPVFIETAPHSGTCDIEEGSQPYTPAPGGLLESGACYSEQRAPLLGFRALPPNHKAHIPS
ncbi:transmembrane protein 40 isoform X6 [Erinaceus europaeus]|uniref:Transmembrane protein 40 isoform X6 n=1 Tax=Erinaceus europaeus TaxID=9365 RepID=A0ABM3WJB8_ERIEU|nr:transmembrane protein 40 isoform X6 [Erinaceus europaeus]